MSPIEPWISATCRSITIMTSSMTSASVCDWFPTRRATWLIRNEIGPRHATSNCLRHQHDPRSSSVDPGRAPGSARSGSMRRPRSTGSPAGRAEQYIDRCTWRVVDTVDNSVRRLTTATTARRARTIPPGQSAALGVVGSGACTGQEVVDRRTTIIDLRRFMAELALIRHCSPSSSRLTNGSRYTIQQKTTWNRPDQ